MKAFRIRYQDYKEEKVISKKTFTSSRTGASYRVVLDFKEMKFFVRNERNKEFVIKSKQYGNMNVLKRNAKEAIIKLGVPLGKEIRDRTFGMCPKGYSQKKHEVKIKSKKDLP